jgi:hypothetical protein
MPAMIMTASVCGWAATIAAGHNTMDNAAIVDLVLMAALSLTSHEATGPASFESGVQSRTPVASDRVKRGASLTNLGLATRAVHGSDESNAMIRIDEFRRRLTRHDRLEGCAQRHRLNEVPRSPFNACWFVP